MSRVVSRALGTGLFRNAPIKVVHTSTMEERETPRLPLRNNQSVDCSVEGNERTMDVPAAVTMSNGGNDHRHHYSTQYNDQDEANKDYSSAYGSSYDASSVSSSVLTSSLSSFEYAGAAHAENTSERNQEADGDSENSSNYDLVAKMMGNMMQHRVIEISHALAERVSCIDSIKWLGHHLPESVVAFLIDEIEVEEAARGHSSQFDEGEFGASSQLGLDSSLPINGGCRKGSDGDDEHDDDDENSIQESDLHEYPKQYPQQSYGAPATTHDSYKNGSAMYKNDDSGAGSYSRHGESARYNNHSENHQSSDHYSDYPGQKYPEHYDYGNNDRSQVYPGYGGDHSDGYDAGGYHAAQQYGGDHYGNCYNEYKQDYNDSTNNNNYQESCGLLNDSIDHLSADGDSHKSTTSLQGPLHYAGNQVAEPRRPQRRRHSVIGMQTTHVTPVPEQSPQEDVYEEPAPRRRMARRSSMPLVVRSMGSSSVASVRRTPGVRHSIMTHVSDSSSGGSTSSLQFHKHNNEKNKSRRMRRRGSLASVSSISSILYDAQNFRVDNAGFGGGEGKPYVMDPFPNSDDERHKQDLRRQDRVMKTRDSIIKLSGGFKIDDLEDEFAALGEGSDIDGENLYFTDVIPPATRHDCALLFVDISGFTKLSTTLKVEPLSKTINNYFQMIVDEVEAFGGDILKFAGDAVFCEWQATTSNPLEAFDGASLGGISQGSRSIEPWHGLGLEECVLTAAACGARIVDKCSDHPVYECGGSSGTQVATLNVHCGVGFGEVVGVHVGDRDTRMEYLILGDPIEQVADAILIASRGEVVASSSALVVLEETAELDACITESDMDKPQVIATKSTCFFHPKGSDHVQQDWTVTLRDATTKPRERLAMRCDDWDLDALTRLRQRMALYVHPVVVNDEFAMKIYPGDRNRAAQRHRSEAELRDVYTIFLMPLITARLTGDDEEDCKVLVLLNDIMLIMTRELRRFKGHLRQFIVDDKGVVLIANFGLRGSTFPNMVAERAIPFTTTVQNLLKAELNTECQIGATYDKAYCGVVGGVTRHEYAVLGPSVNLAARLMGNPSNNGILVDVSVKEKAGSRQFEALQPVKAKGYKHLVPIFEPLQTVDPIWNDLTDEFVGREVEIGQLIATAEDVIRKGGPARLVLVTSESGAGKSALCRQASKIIKEMCNNGSVPHLSTGAVCNEGDQFVPFSITRPLFTEIFNYLYEMENPDAPPRDPNEIIDTEDVMALLNGDMLHADAPPSLQHLVQICEMVDIPDQFIEILGKLVLTRNRTDIVDGPDNVLHTMMLSKIAQYVVKAFLNCTLAFDLVVLALDDVANMDEMSWQIVELLYNHSQNMLIMCTTRPVESMDEMKISEEFWEQLNGEGRRSEKFTELTLAPMEKSEMDQLIAKRFGRNGHSVDPKMSQEVFAQSKGMPNLASEILEKLYKDDNLSERRENSGHDSVRPAAVSDIDVDNIGEIVLHRMDSLPSSVRTHLNLGAILGTAFELMDVVNVFEQYRGVQKEERLKHAESVHESLEEAVRNNILEVTNREQAIHARYNASDHPYAAHNKIYKFTHDVWRSNILRLTLDEWKKDMHSLIAQSMETVMDSQLANDYRVLTRLFSHWKESGSAKKAATLALKMGRSLEDIGLTHQSLIVYRESLDMWKAMDNSNEVADATIGGLSMNLLENLDSSDVEHLIRLNVALGRCYTNILDSKESSRAFQTALNLIHKAPSSVHLEDRSIIFPVFSGLFIALRFGHNEDFQYEQGLVKMFLRETKLFNDPVHYARALAMQAEMLARHGMFETALQTATELQALYNLEEHSSMISIAYGSDRCGQCIAQSALWNDHIGDHEKALAICDKVIKEILPKMDPQNVYNSFHMLYPVAWVMKNNGRAMEAREAFHDFVVHNFLTRLDDRGLTSDRPLHTPIMALLDMVGTKCNTERLEEYAEWALVEKNGLFGSELNCIMGNAGRTADSITAEMCLLLAHHTAHRVERTFFIRKGYEVARDAVELTREKDESHGMILALSQVEPIFRELEELHSHLPPDTTEKTHDLLPASHMRGYGH